MLVDAATASELRTTVVPYGSEPVKWSEPDFGDLQWPPQSSHRSKRHRYKVYGSVTKYCRDIFILHVKNLVIARKVPI